MNLVKVKTSAGVEVYLNTAQILYVRVDPTDEKRIAIFTYKDTIQITGDIESVLKLLKGK